MNSANSLLVCRLAPKGNVILEVSRQPLPNVPNLVGSTHPISTGEQDVAAGYAPEDESRSGYLVDLSGDGRKVQTGMSNPSAIAVLDDHIVVSHRGTSIANAHVKHDPQESGVSVHDRSTLELKYQHIVDSVGYSYRVVPDGRGGVYVGVRNRAQGVFAQQALENAGYALTEDEDPGERGIELSLPIFRVLPDKGLVDSLDGEKRLTRGLSDMAFSPDSGVVAVTYLNSHILLVLYPDGRSTFFNTLQYGVPMPAACAFIPGTSSLVIAGSEENVAIVDAVNGNQISLFGMAFLPFSGIKLQIEEKNEST